MPVLDGQDLLAPTDLNTGDSGTMVVSRRAARGTRGQRVATWR